MILAAAGLSQFKRQTEQVVAPFRSSWYERAETPTSVGVHVEADTAVAGNGVKLDNVCAIPRCRYAMILHWRLKQYTTNSSSGQQSCVLRPPEAVHTFQQSTSARLWYTARRATGTLARC